MKKVLFSILVLMSVMTVQAQSICGTWRMTEPVVENREDGSFLAAIVTYTFNENGTFNSIMETTFSATQPSRTMALEIASNMEVKGNYTLKGDQLTLNYDVKSFKQELVSVSMNGKVVDDPAMKDGVRQKMEEAMKSSDAKKKFAKPATFVVTVGDATLVMNDGKKSSTFKRVATIAH